MPLVAPAVAGILLGKLSSKGFVGPDLPKLCDAIAQGTCKTIVGKSFQTVDVGTITGIGSGTGTGILGLPEGLMAQQVTLLGMASGNLGDKWSDMANAITGGIVQALMTLPTLTSTHTPVFVGTGTVIPGSIVVTGMEWAGNVFNAGLSKGFVGPQWLGTANAIGNGCALGFPMATGNVTIVGSIVTPPPLPGGGSGTGTIS